MCRCQGRLAVLALVSMAALIAGLSRPANGQNGPDGEALSAESIQTRLQEAEASTSLGPDVQRTVLDLYREALDNATRTTELAGRAEEFSRLAAEAPGVLDAIRAELAQPIAPAEPVVPADATLQQIEQLLAHARAEYDAARRLADELQAEAERRANRRAAIPELIAAARQRLATADEALAVPASPQEPADVAAARRIVALTRKAAIEREIEAADREAASYEARRELLPLRRDRAVRRATETERIAAAWERITQERRQREADQATRDAKRVRREAGRGHAVLEELALENEALADSRSGPQGIAARIAAVSDSLASTRSRLAQLRDQFRGIRRKVDVSGLNKATGVLLRRQYESLDDLALIRRQSRAIHRQMNDAEFEIVTLEEARLDAGDIDGAVRRAMEALQATGPDVDAGELEPVARELVTARRDLLDQLIGDYTTYFDRMVDLDAATHDLEAANESYRSFVEERVLWVRSVTGSTIPSVADAAAAARWLFGSPDWVIAARETAAELRNAWGRLAIALAALAVLFAARRRSKRGLRELAPLVTSYRSDRFMLTVRAVVYTAVIAAPIPIFLFAVGWLLTEPVGQPQVAVAAGLGLQAAGLYLLPIELLRHALRRQGLAETHFRWSADGVRVARRHLRWFAPATVPLVFIVVALDRQTVSETWNDSLGRVAFMIGLLLFAGVVRLLLRPDGPVMQDVLRRARGGWIDRMRYVWYSLAIGLPLILIVLAATGYYYSALRLQQQFATTLWLLLGVTLIRGVLLRWLFTARRRLAITAASRKRERALAEKGAATEPMPPGEDHEPDIPAIDAQTQRLFRTATVLVVAVGLVWIWADVLPALRMLDRVQVWPALTIIEAEPYEPATALAPVTAPAAAGPTNGVVTEPSSPKIARGPLPPVTVADSGVATTTETPTVVTLADIGLMLVILVVTFAAARNLPALAEIVVLQRLPMDAGSRYALSTIVRYAILIIGCTAGFSALGIPWSRVQWVVAALTFGLAFGLQEIFANFVSGLIILGERPIRVGDAVTVGEVTGLVSKIRMRATTITDFERKELIVPNKAFVTDQVINWTLSDPVLRLRIPVGVSYGADTDETERILLRLAAEDESVLEDPKPMAVFAGFGDSALNFELRVFIPNLEHLIPTRHRLLGAITKAFRAAGIEIAFPQRDLHVRSAEGLVDIVKREALQPEPVRK